MKIVFFLASLSQPRCIKRVIALYNAGFEVEVYGYSRGFYDVNDFPKEIKVYNWGIVESGGSYWKKFYKNYRNVGRIVKCLSRKEVLFYAFGFDIALLLSFWVKKRFIYESSDLIYTYFKYKVLVAFFTRIDKIIINKSYKTVFTSEGFASYLFGSQIPENIIIQPNKVSPYFQRIERKTLVKESISKGLVFSYVGAFRYPNTVFRFARLIGENYPQHKFFFYGDSSWTYLAKQLAEKYNNIKYFGKFRSPEDLETIYNTIDVVVACYDIQNINERIAEPNKLYEAICFCKPIIVSEKTFLSMQVKKMRVGYSINALNDDSIRDFLDGIDYDDLVAISKREYNISNQDYIDSIESIVKAIQKIHF